MPRVVRMLTIVVASVALLSACGGAGGDDQSASEARAAVTFTTSTAPGGVPTTMAPGPDASTTVPSGATDAGEVIPNQHVSQGPDHADDDDRVDPFVVWRAAMLAGDTVAVRDQVGTAMDPVAASSLAVMASNYLAALNNGVGREVFPEAWFYGQATHIYPTRMIVAGATTWPAAPQFSRVLHFFVEQDPQVKSPPVQSTVTWWTRDADGKWMPADPSSIPSATFDGNEPLG